MVFILVGSLAGVTFYWMRKRANRFDGARVSDGAVRGEVVDIDAQQVGSYVPVVIDEDSM